MALLGAGAFYGHECRVQAMARGALADGTVAFDNGHWNDAGRLLGRYLQKYPNDSKALRLFAEAHLATRPLQPGNIRNAIRAHRHLLLVHSQGEEPAEASLLAATYHQLARLYEQTGNYSELGFVARKRLKGQPDNIPAPIWLAKSLLAHHQPDQARDQLEALIARLEQENATHPEYVEACILLSEIAERHASHVDAEAVLQPLNDALGHYPRSLTALLQRAAARRELARTMFGERREEFLRAARADVERADRLASSDPFERLLTAEAWINEGEFSRAAACLEEIESPDPTTLQETFVDPDDWTAVRFSVAARLALRTGAVDQAVRLADEAIESLTKPAQRRRVIDRAIPIYAAADRVADARRYLDELLAKSALIQPGPEDEERIRGLKALVAVAEGRPHEAIELLELFATTGSSRPDLQRVLAEAYIQTGQSSRAAQVLTECLARTPGDLVAIKKLVGEHIKEQAWAEAVAVARRGEQMYPGDLEITALRIRAQLENLAVTGLGAKGGKTASPRARLCSGEALAAELVDLRDANPRQVEFRVYLARLAARAGRWDAAESELRQAIATSEDSLPAELGLAALYAETDRHGLAADVARHACRQHPTVAAPWLALASLHASGARHREARLVLVEGVQAVTDEADGRFLSRELGLVELLAGDRPAGIARLRQLAAQAPHDVQVRDALLHVPEILQEPQAADALIRELRAVEGENGHLWRFHQARLLLSSPGWWARQEEIAALLRYCLDNNPGWPAPAVILGRMYEGVGQLVEAEELYSETLARDAAIVVAERLLSILERQGRFDEARVVLDEARRRRPSHLWDEYSISLALRSGDLNGAVTELRLRLGGDDRRPEDLVAMARLSYLQGQDATRAFEYLDQARAISPGSLDWVATTLLILTERGRVDEARQVIDDFVSREGGFGSHLLRAAFYQSIGDCERANEGYAELTELTEDSHGYAILAEHYVRSGQPGEAIAVLRQGLEEFSEDPSLARGLATILIARGSPEDRHQAAGILARLGAGLPNDGEICRLRAELLLSEGTEQAVDEARALLQRAIELDPLRIEPYLRLVGILLDRRELRSCDEITVASYSCRLGRIVWFRRRAATLILSQVLTAAREVVARALEIHPRETRLLLARASIELLLDNPAGAKECVQRVLRTQPENAGAIELLAEIAMRVNDLDLLLAVQDQIFRGVERQPDSRRLRVAQAVILVAGGKRELALARLEPAVIVAAANVLATFCSERFQDDARAVFEHVIERAPGNVDAQVGLALLLYSRGDVGAAMAAYQRALQVEPSNVDALNNLAWIMAQEDPDDLGALKEALRLIDRAVEENDRDANLRDTRGFILSRLPGRLEEAREEYRECVRLTKPDTSVHAKALLQLARLCRALNDIEEERRLLEVASRIDRECEVFSAEERAEIERKLNPGTCPQ